MDNVLKHRPGAIRILVLEPYYGGSHRAFLDGWSAHSRHGWTLLSLPAYKWKWRMRHAAVTFAEHVRDMSARGDRWDLLFCSDMLNLAEFLGLAPEEVRRTPRIMYFHENQLTYPARVESERDYQFAMTNMTSALAADHVWFNSAFHRGSFLEALDAFLKRMPDHQPLEAVEQIRSKCQVMAPGVAPVQPRVGRARGPLRILWAARWEHDKNPEDFFEAMRILKERRPAFRLSVIGEQFRDVPPVFEWARRHFAEQIDSWGYVPDGARYEAALREADVFVSTARHEFFGLSAVEAILAGVYPLLPNRLAYPEILGAPDDPSARQFLYDGTVAALVEALTHLAQQAADGRTLGDMAEPVRRRLSRFEWPNRAAALDDAVEQVAHTSAAHPAD